MKRNLIENITELDKEMFKDGCIMCIQSYFDVTKNSWRCAAYDQSVSPYSGCCNKWSRLDAINENVLRW